MWFRLAKATFNVNLGTMESISKSYRVDYDLIGLDGSHDSTRFETEGQSISVKFTFTVKTGYEFKSGSTITCEGTTIFTAGQDYAAGSTFTATANISASVSVSGTASAVTPDVPTPDPEEPETPDVGITNYSIPYTEWDWKQGLEGQTINEDSFSIEVESGTAIVLGRRMQLADTPFNIGDTVYFGIRDFAKEGGNLSLCFMKSDGTEITPRLNANVTQPITYMTKVVPEETAVIQIRVHGSTITSASGGKSYLATEAFDENTVWKD